MADDPPTHDKYQNLQGPGFQLQQQAQQQEQQGLPSSSIGRFSRRRSSVGAFESASTLGGNVSSPQHNAARAILSSQSAGEVLSPSRLGTYQSLPSRRSLNTQGEVNSKVESRFIPPRNLTPPIFWPRADAVRCGRGVCARHFPRFRRGERISISRAFGVTSVLGTAHTPPPWQHRRNPPKHSTPSTQDPGL